MSQFWGRASSARMQPASLVGCGAQVTVLDVNHDRLKYLDDIYHGQLQTRFSDEYNIEEAIYNADLVIGAVLIPGGRAPWLVTADMLPKMRRARLSSMWRLIRRAALKRPGPLPTAIQPMSSMAWCIIVSRTCQRGPAHQYLRAYIQTAFYTCAWRMKDTGCRRNNPALQYGLNTHRGSITYPAIAQEFDMSYIDPLRALGNA